MPAARFFGETKVQLWRLVDGSAIAVFSGKAGRASGNS